MEILVLAKPAFFMEALIDKRNFWKEFTAKAQRRRGLGGRPVKKSIWAPKPELPGRSVIAAKSYPG
jgi:hypothetical protein